MGTARACRATLSVINTALFTGHVLVRASTLGINERQSAVLRRLLDTFDGKLTAKKYQTFAGNISTDIAQRDIADIVSKNILAKSGSTENATYTLVDPRTAN